MRHKNSFVSRVRYEIVALGLNFFIGDGWVPIDPLNPLITLYLEARSTQVQVRLSGRQITKITAIEQLIKRVNTTGNIDILPPQSHHNY